MLGGGARRGPSPHRTGAGMSGRISPLASSSSSSSVASLIRPVPVMCFRGSRASAREFQPRKSWPSFCPWPRCWPSFAGKPLTDLPAASRDSADTMASTCFSLRWIQLSPSHVAGRHPHAVLLAAGLSFGVLAGHLILAHLLRKQRGLALQSLPVRLAPGVCLSNELLLRLSADFSAALHNLIAHFRPWLPSPLRVSTVLPCSGGKSRRCFLRRRLWLSCCSPRSSCTSILSPASLAILPQP